MGKSLDISRLNWQKCDEALLGGLDPREQQLVTKFRERLACGETASEEVVQPVVLPRPAVQRTYSRRGRGQVTNFCKDSVLFILRRSPSNQLFFLLIGEAKSE